MSRQAEDRPLTGATAYSIGTMSARLAGEIVKPKDWQAFQRACVVLFREELRDPNCKEYGRHGQKQGGIDIFGHRNGDPMRPVGIQCRRYGASLKEKDLLADCRAALELGFGLRELLFVTTAKDDTRHEHAAKSIERQLRAEGRDVVVHVYGWGQLETLIGMHEAAYNAFMPLTVGTTRPLPDVEWAHQALWGQSAAMQQELITSAVAAALPASLNQRSLAGDGGSRAMILYELWERTYCPDRSQNALWRVFHKDFNVLIPQIYLDRSLATLESLREHEAWLGLTGELEQPFRKFTRVAADLVALITASDPATNDRKYQEQFLRHQPHGLFFYVVPVDTLDPAIERGNWIETEKHVLRRVLSEMIKAANGIIEAANRMQLFSSLKPFMNPDFDVPPLPTGPYPGLAVIRAEAHAGRA